MKTTILLISLFTFCSTTVTFGQNSDEKIDNIKYQKALQENIFIHYNSSFLLPGENLYYKVYCLKTRTKRLSNISKIAYIELIDSDLKLVFKHKIRLNAGHGDGTFFIPANIKSGYYKLIAYTQWMRNEGDHFVSKNDILIINPFQKDFNITNDEENMPNSTHQIKSEFEDDLNKTDRQLKLNLPKRVYGKREIVPMDFYNSNNDIINGSYSISVRKIDEIEKPKMLKTINYITQYSGYSDINGNFKNRETKFMPELKGDLISGKLIPKNQISSVSNIPLALSIPEKEYILKFALTNEKGFFHFNVEKKYEKQIAVIQALGDFKNQFEFSIDQKKPLKYADFEFNKFDFKDSYKNLIREYSVYNQIENAYHNRKQDTLKNRKPLMEFLSISTKGESYNLDDYKRFSTIGETITEVINSSWIKKKKGNYTIHIRDKDIYDKNDYLPLVVIDGILTQDYNVIVNFDAYKVQEINIIRNEFNFGDFKFQGIISIKTINNNFDKSPLINNVKTINLTKPLVSKRYYNQIYISDNEFDRIPDYRIQLFWSPELKLNGEHSKINFYTSDVKGTYEIKVEGFSKSGKPISISEEIEVN